MAKRPARAPGSPTTPSATPPGLALNGTHTRADRRTGTDKDPARRAGVPNTRRFVVGISGASGAAYAVRLLELLLEGGHEVHLVVTDNGRRLLHDELGITGLGLASLAPALASRAREIEGEDGRRLFIHPHKDVGAVIASGSFLHDGMVVIPCSSSALGYIATGSGTNLLARAAAVTLKERRRLILVHRESPLSLIDIRNMEAVTLAGGTIAPANPGLYLKPTSIAELVDFVVGKCLDLLGVEHALHTRWKQAKR